MSPASPTLRAYNIGFTLGLCAGLCAGLIWTSIALWPR